MVRKFLIVLIYVSDGGHLFPFLFKVLNVGFNGDSIGLITFSDSRYDDSQV